MADENILSSPRKLNSSIHRSRLHRKHKRLNATFTKTPEPPTDNATTFHKIKNTTREEDLSCTLLVMYDSEEDDMEDEFRVANNVLAKVKENYDPFAEQRLLVLADRLAAPSRRSHNFTATQGFQPCHNFLNQFTEIRSEKNNAFHSTKKVEVEITDSELLQVCIETEQSTTNSAINIKQESPEVNQPTNTLTTPQCQQKPKSIVDLILEDFCSSPTSPELKQSSEESNFQFRFANKPLRTYSKRRNSSLSARQNIAVQYEQPANSRCPIADDLLSNGSSTDLSVQEDQTQIAFRTDVEEVVELQHSQSLCENLQNLSAYFTELTGEEVRKETKTLPASHCGNFSSEEDNYLKDEQKELVFENTQLQCSNSLNGHISNDEDFRGFGSEEEEVSVVKKTASKQNCDKMVLNDEDANNLTDKDDWYEECDIFANLDMEAALDTTTSYKLQQFNQREKVGSSIVAQINVEPNIGFRTASNREVKISTEAKARASAILQDLAPLDSSHIPGQDMEADENEDCQKNMNQTFALTKSGEELNLSPAVQKQQHHTYSNQPLNLEMPAFVGFATASNKKITISKEAETKAAKILEQLPPISPSEEINITKQISMHTAPKEEHIFKGFCTASSKEINISKEAQERALKLLEQLPDLKVKEDQDTHKMTGFRTASRKTVQISEDSKKRAALIMKEVMDFDADNVGHNAEECLDNIQFSEWPVEEKEVQEDVKKIDAKSSDMKIGSDANMPGFSTASKKTIKISEAAMQRAAGILEDLPELSTDEVIKCQNTAKNMDTEAMQNMMFSEWPLDDVVGDALDKHEAPPNGMHKRKRNNSDNPATHDAVQALSPQTPKFICTSPSKERSPLTHIQTAVTRSSLSELAIKTPPDYRACRGIISRKNLLSLNKRNKLSAKSLQQSKEFKNDCSAVSTPTNRRRRSITSIGNDIKSPPGTPIPNLQEFFQSATVSTSTPHPPVREQTQMRTRVRKRTELQSAALNSSTKDVSFKRIEWEHESLNKTAASLNASRLSNSSFSNITKMESNPTPKQRIERLRMYGKPPSVSPILMSSTNNCRISGLKRRTRSANKVDEVNKE